MRHFVALLVVLTAPVAAQDVTVLDRIVAVVGTEPILLSQIEEQIVQLRAQANFTLPADSAAWLALRRRIVREMVDDELLMQQAERDTMIKVSEQEVSDQVEKSFQNVRGQFRSEAEFAQQLRRAGFATPEEWRRYLRDQQRRTILRQRLIELLRQQGVLRPLPPTDSAMRAFFEENKAQLPKRPPMIWFRQIVFDAQPDSATLERARRLADSLANALRAGADFATLARNYSADSASAAAGGQLGWFRRGVMMRQFEETAFSLRPGQISDPVRTPFGFHVIEVERVQPAEVLARHILITPRITPERVEEASRRADSIHAALKAGASFDLLARRYSDPAEPRLVDGVQVSQLDQEYAELLTADTTIGLLPPFKMREATGRPRFVIAVVTRRQPAGDFSFEDIKSRIRDRLSQDQALQHYLERLRRDTYVDVRL